MHEVTSQELERRERELLSPDAACSATTLGRLSYEEPDPYRTAFQCDRDRILHCKSFRRLAHKTQVFLAPEGDHYRTRLAHTLEVSQISRSISRALALNEDLTEAIALGHDLGHTPFGHCGEKALSKAMAAWRRRERGEEAPDDLFRHNLQSVRIVELLERNGKASTSRSRPSTVSAATRASHLRSPSRAVSSRCPTASPTSCTTSTMPSGRAS